MIKRDCMDDVCIFESVDCRLGVDWRMAERMDSEMLTYGLW